MCLTKSHGREKRLFSVRVVPWGNTQFRNSDFRLASVNKKRLCSSPLVFLWDLFVTCTILTFRWKPSSRVVWVRQSPASTRAPRSSTSRWAVGGRASPTTGRRWPASDETVATPGISPSGRFLHEQKMPFKKAPFWILFWPGLGPSKSD